MKHRKDWELLKIKDLGKVITGKTPPTAITDNFGHGYLFITPSDMDGRKKISDTERQISAKGAATLKSYILPSKSVCVSCIGWQMGKVVMTTQTSFTNQQINTIIPNSKVIPDFLYYSLSTRREELKLLASVGTRTPILNKSSFEKVDIYLPPLPTQKKIAAILSAYDDLIENNTRRIKILEEMAQTLYHEWFVKFRFPGHEHTKMVDSELGLIPEGWEVNKLGKIASFQTGKLNSNAAKPDGIYPFFTCSQEVFKTDTYSFDTECILLAGNNANGIFHIKFFRGKFDVYQRTYVIRTLNNSKVTNYYLYFAIKEQLDHLKSISTGAATKFLTLTILNNIDITLANGQLQQKFADFISAVFTQIEVLQAKNSNLRQTRDLLLPKLISGEINVENLDITTEDIAA